MILLLILSFYTKGYGQENNPNMGIIPAPVSVKKMEGAFIFSLRTRIISDGLDKLSSILQIKNLPR